MACYDIKGNDGRKSAILYLIKLKFPRMEFTADV